MAEETNVAPIIIKKKKGGGHGHHGGAWKVAYADFVTAMMAFFLLLWLLNATTEEQKKGIAEYFTPTSVSNSNAGQNGVLGGQTLSPGPLANQSGGMTVGIPIGAIGRRPPKKPSDRLRQNDGARRCRCARSAQADGRAVQEGTDQARG